MKIIDKETGNSVYLVIGLVAFIPRILMALFFSEATGDSEVYMQVAKNLLQNGCISLSSIASGDCAPHWGGNQFPGYPVFVAASIWLIPPVVEASVAVGITQSLVASLAIIRMAQVLKRMFRSMRAVVIVGLFLALSPAHLAWSRWVLTESLATTLSIWFFAELMVSIHERRIRVIFLSSIMGLAVLVRYDMIFMVIPLVGAVFWMGNFKRNALALLIVGVLSALPSCAWIARSLVQGLPFPPPSLNIDGRLDLREPIGFKAWVNTWIHNQYQLRSTIWPVTKLRYDDIVIPNIIFQTSAEAKEINLLLEDLKSYTGHEFPVHIDDAFERLAQRRCSEWPLKCWVVNPLLRAGWLWFNPLTSYGWPAKPETVAKITNILFEKGVPGIISAAKSDPVTIIGKIINSSYRLIIPLALALLILKMFRLVPFTYLLLSLLAFLHAVGRSIFFVYSPMVGPESRYIVEAYPPIEVSVGLLMYFWLTSAKCAKVSKL